MPKKILDTDRLREKYERSSIADLLPEGTAEDIIDLINEIDRLRIELELLRMKIWRNDIPRPRNMEEQRLHELLQEFLAFIDNRLLKGEK